MFALIISILAIVFVVVLAAGVLYYGTAAFNEEPKQKKKSKLDFSPR